MRFKTYTIKYVDYFAKGDVGVQIYTYSSPRFEDAHYFYETLTLDDVEKIGYLIISMSEDFETRLKDLEHL